MSEPLKKFLEREFKGDTYKQFLEVLTEGGASEVEDLYGLTEEGYKSLGIKVIPMWKIISAVKKHQAEAANTNSTGPVTDPVIGEEQPIVSADKKREDSVSEPQDQDKALFDYSGQRQAGLVGPQSMSQVLVLNKEGDLDRHLCPTASHEDLTPRSRIEDSIQKEVDSGNYLNNAKSKEDERKDLVVSQEGDLDRPLFPPAIHESATGARKILGQLLAEQIEDSIPMKMDAGSHCIDEESKEEQPISVIDTSHKPSKVGAQSAKSPKPSVSAADTQVGSSVEVFPLFQTFIDSGSEYKMAKIQLNEDQYFNFVNSLVQPETQVVGVFGCFQRALEFIRLQFKDKVPDLFKEIEEGIILFKKKDDSQQVFAVYKCPDPEKFYSYTNSTDQASLASTYLRYLVDFCKEIVVIPPNGLVPNPDPGSPFLEKTNHGMKIKQTVVEPDENLKITEVPQVTDKVLPIDSREVVCSPDQSKYLSFVNMDRQVHHTQQTFYYQLKDIQGQSQKVKSQSIPLSYDDVKNIIIESWTSNSNKFTSPHSQNGKRCFIDNMTQLLNRFISKENQDNFQMICQQFQDNYISKSEILSTELKEQQELLAIKVVQSFVDKLKMHKCDSNFEDPSAHEQKQKGGILQSIAKKVGGAVESTKNFVSSYMGYQEIEQTTQCNKSCRPFQRIIKKYPNLKGITNDNLKLSQEALSTHAANEDFQIHCSLKTEELNQSIQNFAQELIKGRDDLQESTRIHSQKIIQEILIEFFETLEPIVQKVVQSVKNKVEIQFLQTKIVRDTDHKLTGWNISKQTTRLLHQFDKNSTGVIQTKNVIFITDNSGLIHFDNFPDNKSSIYHFNISSRTSPLITLNLLQPSLGAKLLTDQLNLQWCIISEQDRRVNIGKLTKDGRIEDGVPYFIYDWISEGLKVESILSACFLPMGDKLLFLNQDGNIFEYKWQSNTLQAIFKKENKGGSEVVKIKVRPEQIEDNYCEIQASTDGKNIILRSTKSIDVYDLNWDRCFQLPVQEDFLSLKTFTDNINNFMIVITKTRQICYQLVGLSTTKTIKKDFTGNFESTKKLGNPIFDHFYHSFRKFGSHSSCIGAPQSNNLHLVSDKMERNQAQGLIKYFMSLVISHVGIHEQRNIETINLFSNSAINSEHLKMILLGRVAIHLATIENSTLIPLRDGQNISDTIAEITNTDSSDLIEKLTSMIKFGIYEKYLENLKRDIKVISIVGRQSSGKSYVMNRFFGTRFNVSATRCTDGIWMSIIEIHENGDSHLFMIFDCEGLFSARRNEQEEMKLCLALSAISDIMILNQDSSFNRYLNALFDNFSKIKDRIKGKQLFLGKLMMLVRDISRNDSEGTYRELESNLRQIESSKNKGFLNQVFQGELLSYCMHNFELTQFNQEVDEIRSEFFLTLKEPRWLSGQNFTESLKITLAQIYTDDDTDIDIHKINILCERMFQDAQEMFYNGGEKFQGKQSILRLEFQIQEQQFAIEVPQSSIKLKKEEDPVDGKEEMSLMSDEVMDQFESQSRIYGTHIHNEWVRSFGLYLREMLEQRTAFILSYFTELLPKESDFQDIINSTLFQLRNLFQIYSQKIQYCDKTCRKCKRLCMKQLNHHKDCDCETDHICQAQCTINERCINGKYLCADKYGHENDHKCNNGNHKCSHICEIPDCGLTCSGESGHSDLDVHNCGNKHLCTHKCEDNYCTRICKFDQSNQHQRHYCGEKRCNHKCDLCDRQCIFPDHFHDKSIVEGNNANLVFISPEGKSYPMIYHICDQKHQCKSNCVADGICSVAYDVEEKYWKSPASPQGFPYQYFRPKEKREVCKIMIENYEKKHEGNHNCKIAAHRCTNQCPECKSYCQKDYGHHDYHHTESHRNKENSVFASATGSQLVSFIGVDGKMRSYNVGETCKPESCQTSCARKGRAHYHIKECKGAIQCDSKTNPKIKHAAEKFEPYPTKVFDKWLCQSYWNSFNWNPPIGGDQLTEALSCNYICAHREHGDKRSFCIKSALHTDQHQFDCKHEDWLLSNVIDIVFCCDATGSMGSYIEKSKDTCEKIIKNLKKPQCPKNRSINFGFFAYRDHPPHASYVVREQPLTDEPKFQQFLKTVTAGEGGGLCAAVMDGLKQSINNAGWRDKSMRYIFHIADAPCYGRQYGGGDKYDYYPQGCPCGTKIEDLAKQMKEKKIRYKLVKIGDYPNIMASEFKKHILDYEECDLDSASKLEIAVTEILVRDVQEEVDVIKS